MLTLYVLHASGAERPLLQLPTGLQRLFVDTRGGIDLPGYAELTLIVNGKGVLQRGNKFSAVLRCHRSLVQGLPPGGEWRARNAPGEASWLRIGAAEPGICADRNTA